MTPWYCYIQGQQYGPVDEPTIRQWVRERRLLPENMVWNPELPDWMPARDVPGLLEATGPGSVGAQPPPVPAGVPGSLYSREQKPHKALLVLVLAIVGWVSCCFVFDVIAVILASGEIREMDAGQKDPSGRGMAKAAQILAIIHLGLIALSTLTHVLTAMVAP
jgi:hypothetical protein